MVSVGAVLGGPLACTHRCRGFLAPRCAASPSCLWHPMQPEQPESWLTVCGVLLLHCLLGEAAGAVLARAPLQGVPGPSATSIVPLVFCLQDCCPGLFFSLYSSFPDVHVAGRSCPLCPSVLLFAHLLCDTCADPLAAKEHTLAQACTLHPWALPLVESPCHLMLCTVTVLAAGTSRLSPGLAALAGESSASAMLVAPEPSILQQPALMSPSGAAALRWPQG